MLWFLHNIINLSEEEKSRLVNTPRGTAIIHASKNTLMVDVISSSKEHQFISTDRVDLQRDILANI